MKTPREQVIMRGYPKHPKRCATCKECKPRLLEFWHKCRSYPDGLVTQCKDCRKMYEAGFTAVEIRLKKRFK